ncbi:hypothetical protein NDU88_002206 [Pleurodeles waltl]|uniref:Uncharacterized protein n=1 Tax=Pleurodeles waltl TaxID=8319 RepID=A0AAV7UXP5_PLEWA|nr:hypothetical protein NDU88_002206 [Pleurodeles waltl]
MGLIPTSYALTSVVTDAIARRSGKHREKRPAIDEDSEANSSGCTQSDEEDNISSDLETSLSSATGPTVKLLQRQRKCIKGQPGSVAGVTAAGHSAATLKWDYSGISLCTQEKGPKTLTPLNDNEEEDRGDDSMGNTEETMLQLIYGTIKELQTETRTESCKARLATKQLQVTVRKVAKTCGEIEEKLNAMENRACTTEADIEVLKDQAGMQGKQLTDIMWTMEDYENQPWRNNLRFLGIEEGAEGIDIRNFMIDLLRKVFPDLT